MTMMLSEIRLVGWECPVCESFYNYNWKWTLAYGVGVCCTCGMAMRLLRDGQAVEPPQCLVKAEWLYPYRCWWAETKRDRGLGLTVQSFEEWAKAHESLLPEPLAEVE